MLSSDMSLEMKSVAFAIYTLAVAKKSEWTHANCCIAVHTENFIHSVV